MRDHSTFTTDEGHNHFASCILKTGQLLAVIQYYVRQKSLEKNAFLCDHPQYPIKITPTCTKPKYLLP